MILSLVTAGVVLLIAAIAVGRLWSRSPWSAPEPANPTLPQWRRARADDRYESAVERGLRVPHILDRSLRPMLREIAESRLRRRGIDLHAQPDASIALLGPDLAEALGVTRPPTNREHLMTTDELDVHLRRLESL
jgi:hypothetical protein